MTTSATGQEPTPQEAPGGDRVREHSDPGRLRRSDAELRERVKDFIGKPKEALTARIRELEDESDVERVLAANASILSLLGVAGGLIVNRRLFVVPLVVLAFLLQHALQGWCPPLPLFRRLGVRSRQEIDAERYALKAMRGDFDTLTQASN